MTKQDRQNQSMLPIEDSTQQSLIYNYALVFFNCRTHLSFCFNFFLHGESSVCASIEVKQHPPVWRLTPQHLTLTQENHTNFQGIYTNLHIDLKYYIQNLKTEVFKWNNHKPIMNKRYHYGHTILEHILHAIPQLSNKNLTFNDKCTNFLGAMLPNFF